MNTIQKKTASLWWLVSTYYLSFLFIQFVAAVVWMLVIVAYLIPTEWWLGSTLDILTLVWNLFFVWVGVLYGGQFITNRYTIPNSRAVIKWSMITAVVVTLISIGDNLLFPVTDSLYLTVEGILAELIYLGAFYFFTKKYLTKMSTSV